MRNFLITIAYRDFSDTKYESHILKSETYPNRVKILQELKKQYDFRIWGDVIAISELSDQDVLEYEAGY